MVTTDTKIIEKFEYLVEEGKNLVELLNYNESTDILEMARINSWVMRSGHIIESLCDNNDVYLANFEKVFNSCDFSLTYRVKEIRGIAVILGIISGLYADYSSGLLDNVRNLLRGKYLLTFLTWGSIS